MDFELFSELSAIPAASGREELLRDYIISLIKPLADDIKTDALGNIIALKKGKGVKKLMLAAHMDEVAMRVRYIDDSGFLRFALTGGIDPRTLLSQRVLIQTENNGILHGVIGSKPAHYLSAADLSKPTTADSLFIDIGLSAQKAKEVITIGDPVTLDRPPLEFGEDLFCAKAIDDRAGVYILIKTLQNLPKEHDADIYFVFTVQEEFGLIGAEVSSFALRPDVALAVDTTGALDVPDIPARDYVLKTGSGIGITLVDSTTIAHNGVVKHLREICAKNDIPCQLRVASKGSNDAKVMQRSADGVPVCALSLPVRYIHSNVEVASKKDVDAAVALAGAFALQCAQRDY